MLDGCRIGGGSWVHDAVVDAGVTVAEASAVSGGIVGYPGPREAEREADVPPAVPADRRERWRPAAAGAGAAEQAAKR